MKTGVLYVGGIYVLRYFKDSLKEELAWIADKQLQVIINITSFIPLRN